MKCLKGLKCINSLLEFSLNGHLFLLYCCVDVDILASWCTIYWLTKFQFMDGRIQWRANPIWFSSSTSKEKCVAFFLERLFFFSKDVFVQHKSVPVKNGITMCIVVSLTVIKTRSFYILDTFDKPFCSRFLPFMSDREPIWTYGKLVQLAAM